MHRVQKTSGNLQRLPKRNDMRRNLQEKVFVAEIRKRIFHLVNELDLNAFFLIGALEMIIHELKNDIDLFNDIDDDDDDRDTKANLN